MAELSTGTSPKVIGVMGAMPPEIAMLQKHVANVEEIKINDALTCFRGNFGGKTVVFASAGVGTVFAATTVNQIVIGKAFLRTLTADPQRPPHSGTPFSGDDARREVRRRGHRVHRRGGWAKAGPARGRHCDCDGLRKLRHGRHGLCPLPWLQLRPRPGGKSPKPRCPCKPTTPCSFAILLFLSFCSLKMKRRAPNQNFYAAA